MNSDINSVVTACLSAIKFSQGSQSAAEAQVYVEQAEDKANCMVNITRPKKKGALGLFGLVDSAAPLDNMFLSFAVKMHPEDEQFRLFEIHIINPEASPEIESFNEYQQDDTRTPVPASDYPAILAPLEHIFLSNPRVTPDV